MNAVATKASVTASPQAGGHVTTLALCTGNAVQSASTGNSISRGVAHAARARASEGGERR
jgi:hypothetical protein